MALEYKKVGDILGICVYSPNKEYFILTMPGHGNDVGIWQYGFVALFKNHVLVFNMTIEHPLDFVLSNNGTIFGYNIVFGKYSSDKKFDDIYFLIYNQDDDINIKKKLIGIPGVNTISADGNYVAFETNYINYMEGDSIFIIDVYKKGSIIQIPRSENVPYKSLTFNGNLLIAIDNRDNKLQYKLPAHT